MARIYVSSTYEDLKAFREAAYRVLRQLGHDVVAMEDYVAADARPLQKCLDDVTGCDAYVGLIGFRYGFVPNEDNPAGKSITELEYRAAERQGKPRLVFIYKGLADPNSADVFTGQGDGGRLVKAFKEELQSQRLVSEFTTADELGQKVAVAVGNALRAAPAIAEPVSDEDRGLEMLRRSARDILKLYCAKSIHDKLHEIYLRACVLRADDPVQIDGRMLSDVAAYCAPRMTSIADAVSDCDRYLNESNRNSIEGHREELERAIGLLRNAASSAVDAERSAAVGEFNERLATWLSELDNALKELADRLDGDEIRAAIGRLKEAYAVELEPVERHLHALMDDVNPVLKKCKALIEEHHGLQDVHDKFPGLFDWLTKRDVGVAASEWRRLKRRLNSAREAWKQFGALPSGGENWEADVRDDGEETWKLAETCISNIDTMLLPEASAEAISLVVPPLSKLQARVETHFKIVDEALREGYRPVKVRVGEAIMQIQ
jgi:hypothetical protein